jgi:hypothetical protein
LRLEVLKKNILAQMLISRDSFAFIDPRRSERFANRSGSTVFRRSAIHNPLAFVPHQSNLPLPS